MTEVKLNVLCKSFVRNKCTYRIGETHSNKPTQNHEANEKECWCEIAVEQKCDFEERMRSLPDEMTLSSVGYQEVIHQYGEPYH
jgi:hypothetical protein